MFERMRECQALIGSGSREHQLARPTIPTVLINLDPHQPSPPMQPINPPHPATPPAAHVLTLLLIRLRHLLLRARAVAQRLPLLRGDAGEEGHV